jgi:predicted Zn-dependent protease
VLKLNIMTRHVWVAALTLLFSAGILKAQTSTSPSGIPQGVSGVSVDKKKDSDESPLTTFEEELRAKRAIRLAEKEHEENLKRAREISQIGQDLKASLANASVTKPDPKKVDRLEKLTRKVRGEAGGDDDDVQIVNTPSDIPSAVNQIADAADQLSKDVEKTPRQVVSAAVIDRANILLELVKILRGFIR